MILDEVTCRFGLYNGSNGHGGGFSSGVLLVFFWVLLGSSGVLLAFFWRSSVLSNTRRTPEEHQKNTRRNARRTQKNPEEGEEHQPPLLIPGDNPTTIWWKNARSLMMAFAIYFLGAFQHPAILYCDATLRGTKIPWPPIVTKSFYAEWSTLVHCSSPNSLRPG